MPSARRARRLLWIPIAFLPAIWLAPGADAQASNPFGNPGCNLTFAGPLHIPVTGPIGGIVIDDRCKYVYLTNTNQNRVEVFSLDTLTLEAPIQVGSQPVGLDFTWLTNILYVCNSGGENISVVDVGARTELRKINVPPRPNFTDKPYSIAFAGFTGVFSTTGSGNRIMTVDAWSDTVTHRTDFTGTASRMRLSANADRSRVGIVTSSSTVYVYSLNPGTFSPAKSLSGSIVDGALEMFSSLMTVTPGTTGTYVLDSALNHAGTILVDPGQGGTGVDPEWHIGYRAVASRLDVLNLSTFLKTGELPLGDTVATASSTNFVGRMDTSQDGTLLAVITDNGFSLVRPWPVAPAGRNLVRNGSFPNSSSVRWQSFTVPASPSLTIGFSGGALIFNRPPGSTQATVFQETGMALPAGAPIQADFDLRNSSPTRKRISVVLLNANFNDLHVCTFWLPPQGPLRTYRIRTHTTRPWTNAAIYFYAATAGNDGHYVIDNVSVRSEPALPDDRTDCIDPLAPVPPGGPDEASLLVNGDFETGDLAPWGTFGTITSQISGGVFEFIRPDATPPAGVILQNTGQAMAADQILTATFSLGNSSAARKRVTAILHDNDFSDLTACTFWLEPGQPLSPYSLRTFTTRPWTDATLSFYASSVGPDQWIQLDDVTLRRTPGAAVTGTECIEPVTPVAPSARGGAPRLATQSTTIGGERRSRPADNLRSGSGDPAVLEIAEWLDLTDAVGAQLTFESWLASAGSLGEIQLSRDGIHWITHATVGSSDTWEPVAFDLSDWTGGLVAVRFVANPPAGSQGAPTMWRLRGVRVSRDRPGPGP